MSGAHESLAWTNGVLGDAELPSRLERAGKNVAMSFGQPDVRGAHAAPSSGDGDEQVRTLADELRLNLGCEHQITEAVLHGRERREDVAADAKVDGSHVRPLLGAIEAQCDVCEVCRGHGGANKGKFITKATKIAGNSSLP